MEWHTVQSLQVSFERDAVVPDSGPTDIVSNMFCIDDDLKTVIVGELVTYFVLLMVCQQLLSLAVGPDLSD